MEVHNEPDPRRFLLVVLTLADICSARAEVTLNGLISDHMVLQRDIKPPVWGTADNGEKVTVAFRGHTASTVAQNGKWTVRIGPFDAGGPDELTVKGSNTLVVKDVLVGEVWIYAGHGRNRP